MTRIAVACAQHRLAPLDSWDGFAARYRERVADAAGRGARLLVFPEYGSLELVTLLPAAQRHSLEAQVAGVQALWADFSALFRQLARDAGVWLVAPSFPLREGGRYLNRALVCGPAGQCLAQDKLHMTRFERELFDISPGGALQVFDAGDFRFAVAICYDAEFPQQVHALVRAGAQVIAVPSCTDGLAGYHRVELSARARALENQCFVLQSPLLGDAPWCEAIDVNVGWAGIYSPVDRGFPVDGVLARGDVDTRWLLAELDLRAMQQVRDDGQVFNLRDWAQPLPEASGA